MKTILTPRKLTVALLLGWGLNCSAMSIGPLQGGATIGRPLNLSAPLRFDNTQDAENACLEADVMYGDVAVAAHRVRVSMEGSTARLVSSAVVDEPVVTVVLRAGCKHQSVRNYVVLADPPRAEVVAAAVSVPAVPMARTEMGAAPITRERAAPAHFREAAAVKPARAAPARLQLGVWEPGAERSPWLRVSSELLSTPATDQAQRAAAAALWLAITAQPQDLLRTVERLRALEAEIAALRELSARNRADMAGVRELLQKKESRRLDNLLLAVALLLLAGGTVALFWYRTNKRAVPAYAHSDWYRGAESELPPAREPAPAAPQPPLPNASDMVAWEPVAITPPAVEVERPAPPQALKAEALQAAQQQADFFSSLGQADEAIRVLAAYIDESVETAPLAYLELLSIFHMLGCRDEFDNLREEFHCAFGLEAPAFEGFREREGDLEEHPAIMLRVTAAWPSPEVLGVIEEQLFRKPRQPRELLPAQAYRELLWLYSLVQEVIFHSGAPAGLRLREDTGLPTRFILPWVTEAEDEEPQLSLDRLRDIDVAAASTRFGVDVDLSDAPGDAGLSLREPAAQVSPPEPQLVAEPGEEEVSAFDAVMESESRKLFAYR